MQRFRLPALRVTLAVAVGAYGVWAALHALRIATLTAGAALGLYWPALVAVYALLHILAVRSSGSRALYGAVFAAAVFFLLAHTRAIGVTSATVWQLVVAAFLVGVAVALLTGSFVPHVRVYHGRRSSGEPWWGWFAETGPAPSDPVDHAAPEHDGEPGSSWTHNAIGDMNVSGWGPRHELRSHRYHQGMGDIRLDLSQVWLREGETRVSLHCGMGEIQLLVPDGMAVHLRGQVRLGEVSLFDREASGVNPAMEFVSEGYEAAERRVRVDMFCGMGEITAAWVR